MMDSEQDNITLGEMIAVEDGLYAKGFGVAADLVSHYLDNTGTPMQINAGQLMHDVPAFNAAVQAWIKNVRREVRLAATRAGRPSRSTIRRRQVWHRLKSTGTMP
jgi:hypothetical protein